MTDFRNDLLTRMIRIYGFEHPLVVAFAKLCETYISPDLAPKWDECLEALVECHESISCNSEEEE